MNEKKQLLALLRERSFFRSNCYSYTLASGEKSNVYIDARKTTLDSEGARLVGDVMYDELMQLEKGVHCVGGPEAGAIPIVTATLLVCNRHGHTVPGFWVKKAVKDHGTKSRIEGCLSAGDKVVLLDDVVTRGGSVAWAIQEVRRARANVVAVIALVDRLAGARKLLYDLGVEDFRTIFTVEDLCTATA